MKLAEVLSKSQHRDLLQMQQDIIDALPSDWDVNIVKHSSGNYVFEVDTQVLKAPWKVTAFENSNGDGFELEYKNPSLSKTGTIILDKLPLPFHSPNETDAEILDHIRTTWSYNESILKFQNVIREDDKVYVDVVTAGYRQLGLQELVKLAIHYYDGGDTWRMIPDPDYVKETLDLINRIEPA